MFSRRLFALIIAIVITTGVVSAQPSTNVVYEVAMARNVPYAEDDEAHPRRVLDVYVPDGAENFPVLMFVSGGGWSQGSKEWVANVGVAFARRGIGVATVDHRLVPEVTYAGQVEDLARAFVWLRENIGEVQGDASRIVVGGHSAGAHLISMLAVDPQYLAALGHDLAEINGVIPISGTYRFTSSIVSSGVVPDEAGAVDAASPLTYVQADLPPFLLLYAGDESRQAASQAELMQESMIEVGVSATIAEIPDRDHFTITQLIGVAGDLTTQTMFDWMTDIFAVSPETD